MMSFPAVTIREAMERPEALDTGSIVLTGLDIDTVMDAIGLVMIEGQERSGMEIPAEYCVSDTSWRVLKLILGTTKLSNLWGGIKVPSEFWGK